MFLLRSSCYRLHGFQSTLCDEVEEIVPQRYNLWIKNQHGSHFANVKVVVMKISAGNVTTYIKTAALF